VILSVGAVSLALPIIVATNEVGMVAGHMLLHIALMSVAAPLAAIGIVRTARASGSAGALWLATIAQIVTLWAWHGPGMPPHGAHGMAIAMHASLFATAVWFWMALVRLAPAQQWHAIPALLLTGKLACLLAALLVFSPRALQDTGTDALGDQHLAGLAMIVACPLSYITAAIGIVTQILFDARSTRPAGAG
jgi:putative membrane protein